MLYCCVFLCGAALMIIELAGSRIVAPFLGTSLIVWTSLIGVILASLSTGAWWGGLLADRRPERSLLGKIILCAAWATAAVGLTKFWVLELIQAAGTGNQTSLFSIIILFAPSSFLLGAVSPFAIRLQLTDTDNSGQTAGILYALSTIGSIIGTFLAGFYLLAFIGSTSVMYITAVLLVIASFLADQSNRVFKLVSFLFFLAAVAVNHENTKIQARQGFIDTDTPYNRVLVYNSLEQSSGRPTVEMMTGPEGRQSSMYRDSPSELALSYTRYYQLAEYFSPEIQRILVLGGGGFSFPKFALARYPEAQIDVVEMDGGIIALAYSHFALSKNPRLTIYQEDARTFLRKTSKRYDVILCDVFNSHYSIPPHMVTVETAQMLSRALTESGVVLVNLLASQHGKSSNFFAALYSSYKSVFSSLKIFAVTDPADTNLWQNLIFSAQKHHKLNPIKPSDHISEMLKHEIPPPQKFMPPFTDDFAPVDRYIGNFTFFH